MLPIAVEKVIEQFSGSKSRMSIASYGAFSDWCGCHSHLIPFLDITTEKSAAYQGRPSPFAPRRALCHTRAISSLEIFLHALEKRSTILLAELDGSTEFTVEVPPLIYDDPFENRLCRILAFLQQRLFEARLSRVSHELFVLESRKIDTEALMALLRGALTPADMAIDVLPSFLEPAPVDPPAAVVSAIRRIRAALPAIVRRMQGVASPVWCSDFPLFVRGVVSDLVTRSISTIGYWEWVDSEISLSRCLVMPEFSEYLQRVDRVDPRELTARILNVVDEILFEKVGLEDFSIAEFALFRAMFDICYVTRGDIWRQVDLELIGTVARLSHCAMADFKICGTLLSSPFAPDQTVREYVLRDENWSKAAGTLSLALFASNPFDALYFVHLTLVDIKLTALANVQKNSGSADDVTLSFDDMFALFLTVFLGSDLIDIFSLAMFVRTFAPENMSSSFEYARMMLDALDVHVRNVDFGELA
jgi:hypothetical protein